MANYRRLISYIYAYEGGIKGKNVGFAKIENRKDQCRIQVSVRNVYVGSQDIGVYLMSTEGERLLGNDFYPRRCGEFRCMVQMDHGMSDCYGLTIHSIGDSWAELYYDLGRCGLPMLLRWICQMPLPKKWSRKKWSRFQQIRFQNSQPQETGPPEVGSRSH